MAVLSINSHVVHGRVGNTATTFPLQLLGYEVDVLNSIQICTHPGYADFDFAYGQVLDGTDLRKLLTGLQTNNLLRTYTHVLTGFVGSSSFLSELYEFIVELKKCNPNITYNFYFPNKKDQVCDPVMGDNGSTYTHLPKDLFQVYAEKLIKVADIITPNCFEAEYLTGISIQTESDAEKAMMMLLEKGVKAVIITSIELVKDTMLLVGRDDKGGKVRVVYPKIKGSFTGAGDLFTALLLGWSGKGHSLQVACEKAVSTMQVVLTKTLEHAKELSGTAEPSPAQKELQLVQCKEFIENPPQFVQP